MPATRLQKRALEEERITPAVTRGQDRSDRSQKAATSKRQAVHFQEWGEELDARLRESVKRYTARRARTKEFCDITDDEIDWATRGTRARAGGQRAIGLIGPPQELARTALGGAERALLAPPRAAAAAAPSTRGCYFRGRRGGRERSGDAVRMPYSEFCVHIYTIPAE
eukprot:SAG31_NODE_11254_length_1049_cov_1.449474_1_plen_168_part_00